jgi:hypothetical protein
MPNGFAILMILIGLMVFYYFIPVTQEGFQSQSQIVICLLCICPTERVLAFAKRYTETHPVYVVCDDPMCAVPDIPGIVFVKLTDEVCKSSGYNNSNPAITKRPAAWDKALYYFCVQNNTPDYVWFVEEDVFVPRETIFQDLDMRYPSTDYIMKQHVKDTDDPAFHFWYEGDGKMNRPFYRSLVCATRISRRLLNLVKKLHDEKGTLVFIEIMFNTLAVQNGMTMEMPQELQTIIFRHNWDENSVNKDQLFHPVKDTKLHDTYRKRLAQITEG